MVGVARERSIRITCLDVNEQRETYDKTFYTASFVRLGEAL